MFRATYGNVENVPLSPSKLLFLFILLAELVIPYKAQADPAQEAAKDWPPGWTEKCIGCICEAASACNQTIGCIDNDVYCGMFLISKPYWLDSDSPVLLGDDKNEPEAFGRCVQDSYCASRTVNQYINKYLQDCNNDGLLSCDDYARLHYFGYTQCSKAADNVPFYHVFRKCFFG